jgi:hypothetical protein
MGIFNERMKMQILKTMLAIAATTAITAWGADTTSAAGATGQCKDGTYTTSPTHKGACSDHGGVKNWFADKQSTPATAATDRKGKGDETTPKSAGNNAERTTSTDRSNASVAPGGGAGKVWVNTKSKVYHCRNDRWYGKTKQGEYMSEAEAKAKGNHADHGKACSA